MSKTLGSLIDVHGVDVLDYLDRASLVHIGTGLQRQGDVLIAPTKPGVDAGSPVGSEGVAVVRGENGGNTHLLLGGSWRPVVNDDPRELVLGVLTVESEAFLAHPEHGYLGIGPGCYTIRRQREMADEIRRVAD